MFLVGEAVVEHAVAHERFCCDLRACRGACCTLEGGRGAPLEDDEVAEIRGALPVVRPYLSEASLRVIEEEGIVEGRPGDYATPCISNRACVYVYEEEGIARCSFERAYLEGKLQWRKPISCHLFPIRVRKSRPQLVSYEAIAECAGGRARGLAEEVKVRDFLREALIRRFGKTWYETFLQEAHRQETSRTGVKQS